MFADRREAGRRLAEALETYRDRDVVVLALPRGGVAVAAEVARHLRAPLDLILVRKIGAPDQPELAIGALVGTTPPHLSLNEDIVRALGISDDYLDVEQKRHLAEIERRRRLYFGHLRSVPLENRIAVIVDDGMATGATMRAALHAARRSGAAEVVVAVPVAPPDTVAEIEKETDALVCLEAPSWFYAIGAHYLDFRQLSDDDVVALLEDETLDLPQ